MFPVIALMFFLSLTTALAGLLHGNFLTAPLLACLLSGLAMLIVFVQRQAHPEAFFDWIQGGVTGILQDDSRALRWQDWEILLSRRGEIDLKTRTLRIEKRAFFNLLPFGVEERSLDDFYRVTIETAVDSPGRRLELRANDTRHVLILDLGHGGGWGQSLQLLNHMRERLTGLVEAGARTVHRRDAAAGAGLADRLLKAHEGDAPAQAPRWTHTCELEHRGRTARRDHLLQLQRELDGARYVRSSRSRGWINGQHEGRSLTLSTWISDDEEPEEDLTQYTLAIDSPTVLRATRPAERLEVTPEERLPYVVTSTPRDRMIFDKGTIAPVLRELFDELGCRDLTVEKGTIYAEKPAHSLDLCPAELQRFFDCLVKIAQMLEGEASKLVTTIATSEQTRCPFCRDDLRPAEEDLVDCASCGTRHHAECFEDLGECTIRGCSSRDADPVPRRLGGPPTGRVRS